MCTLRELTDGTYTLTQVAFMNDTLDVLEENQRRAHDAQEAARRAR